MLKTIRTTPEPIDPRLRVGAKKAKRIYGGQPHKAWAAEVKRRAGYRCQWPGCNREGDENTLFADHIVEIQDGGSATDLANGQALCGRHHSMKTAQERKKRYGLD